MALFDRWRKDRRKDIASSENEVARAHFDRGNILLDRGDAKKALDAYAKAMELKPDSAAIHYNIANALLRLNRPEEGMAECRKALVLKPDFADAYVTLGVAHQGLGQLDKAVSCYRKAIKIKPDAADAHYNLATTLMELGQLEESVICFDACIELRPDYIEAVHNRGIALNDLGRLTEAMASYRQALGINPEFVEALYNLGAILQSTGELERAMECYRSILEKDAVNVMAHNNLGIVLGALGQYEAALACYRKVIEIQPDNAGGHLNLGITLATIGRFDSAMVSYQKALEIEPDNAEAHVSLGGVQQDRGQYDAAVRSLRRAIEIRPDYAMAHSNLLVINNYTGDLSAQRTFDDARHFGKMLSRLAKPFLAWPNNPDPKRRLRIGLISGDLCNHPVGYFLEGVIRELASHAAERVELFAYSSRRIEDSTSQRIKTCCSKWHTVDLMSDDALAGLIRADGVDILIDLSGHMALNRLPVFASKPAPVQVSWLGYFATTGVPTMDYLIADPWTLPQELEIYFTEQVWRLPETRLCFTKPDGKVEVGPLPVLSNRYITFGCFNNLTKMNDAVVALWAQILNKVPGSRLFLKYRQLAEASVRQMTCERFAVHGIDATRLMFEGYTAREHYLTAYHRVDIALDPFPFPGGTTTVEALWMGVPVLTLAGESFLSRQGVGLLMNAGLPDWIASGPEDYIARAAAHASSVRDLASLRAGLREKVLASPIFDAPRFARHFEEALRGMWTKWCEVQPQHGSMNP